MDFPLMNAYRDFIEGGSLRAIYGIFTQDHVYTNIDNLLTFIDNHDTPRAFFIADGQTDRVKVSLAMLLTTRGIVQLLYGTEIGMLGGQKHVELRANFPGGFPGDRRNAFSAAGRTKAENDIFDYLRTLVHLRKQHPALAVGKMVHMVPEEEVYMYLKVWRQESILVIVNGNQTQRPIDFSDAAHWFEGVKRLRNLLSGGEIPFHKEMKLKLGGMKVGIFQLIKSI
jgi:glycosidase